MLAICLNVAIILNVDLTCMLFVEQKLGNSVSFVRRYAVLMISVVSE